MMRQTWPMQIFCIFLVATGLATSGFSQDTGQDLRKEIEALKQGQQMIRKELQEIKALIRATQPARPAAPDIRDVEFNLGDNPVRGENTAFLTLVEFTDYE